MTPENLGSDRRQALSRLLGLYKAEWLNGQLFELFTEPPYFGELKTNRPCVLIGGRGTGKTTLLKGLSYKGQYALSGQRPSAIREFPFYGLYYRVNTNRVTAFRGPEVSEAKWVSLFGHYVNLLFCQLMLEFVTWFELNTGEQVIVDDRAIQRVQIALGFPNCTSTLSDLATDLENELLEFEASINTISDGTHRRLSLQGVPIDELAKALTESTSFSGKQFLFLIDEFENFEDYQQRVLNTIVKHASSTYTFKIGVRELGWRERATLNPNEQLTHPADYARISINDVLTPQRFKQFAERVVNSRLHRAYGLNEDDISTIGTYLPELSELDEAELLMEPSRQSELLAELEPRLTSAEFASACTLRPAHLNFISYWAGRPGMEAFAECVRSWLRNEAEWQARINNHFYASLFVIRKGKRGIQKHYAGWDTYLTLANGNIRYLLELVHTAFLGYFESENAAESLKPIDATTQTIAAQNVGKKNLTELEGLSVEGAKLTKLLLSLGRVFQVLASDPQGHTPEVNQFHLSHNSSTSEVEDSVKQILDHAVMHQALVRFAGNKLIDEADTREYDFMVHPVFSAFFVFSHRRKRKLALEPQLVMRLIGTPREAIRVILEKSNRIYPESLPDQLELFGSYYD